MDGKGEAFGPIDILPKDLRKRTKQENTKGMEKFLDIEISL